MNGCAYIFGLTFLLVASSCVVKGNSNLRGKKGDLHASDDHNDTQCNREKLMIEFDNECAIDYVDVKNSYKKLVNDFSECLYEDKHKHKENIYFINVTSSYHAFIWLKTEGCEDNISIDYDDYCIFEFEYEPEAELQATCSSEASWIVSTYLYHTDVIDGNYDNQYNYVSGGGNAVDIFILDSGVLSTHDEFSDTTVIHMDSTFGDSDIASNHGTHVAGLAGGKTVGAFKHASYIYSYPTCRYGTGCGFQYIEDGLIATINKLQENPSRRGVINMSFGSTKDSSRKTVYENYFSQIIEAGGIPLGCAGNSGRAACLDDGTSFTPASADNCISVGAYDEDMVVSDFSNYGECVDVYAPGGSVASALKSGDSSYGSYGGTSQASPIMAGVVANLLYVNDELTYDEIYDIVTSGSYSVSLNDCNNDSGEGNCNGFGMTCDEIIDAAGGEYQGNEDDTDYDGSIYTCSDGCEISRSLLSDKYCDCSDCGDEANWNCNTCDCPTSCGSWKKCDGTKTSTSSNDDIDIIFKVGDYVCDDGCTVIPQDYFQDNAYCDCADCSDEEEWTCDSCAGGCPSGCLASNYTYCFSTTSSSSNSDSELEEIHSTGEQSSGSGSHCGCSGNNEEYDTLIIGNLNVAVHGASQVYDFNGEWILVSGCMNGASYYTKSVLNDMFDEYETFLLYYNGGGWYIGKESSIDGYWAGCPQTDLFDCNEMFWVYGINGYDSDSVVTTESNNVCGTSSADATSTSLSVALSIDESSSSSSSSSSSTTNNSNDSNELDGLVWLLITCLSVISICAIGIVYVCACTDYKLVKQGVEYSGDPTPYNLMQE